MAAAKTNTNVKPTPAKEVKMLTIGQIAALRASNMNTDTSRAAKEIRSRLRANFSKVLEIQPDVAKAKTAANDGNRWPLLTEDVVTALKLTSGARVTNDSE